MIFYLLFKYFKYLSKNIGNLRVKFFSIKP